MAYIILEVTDETASEVAAWAESHKRMMITSTVPAAHNWDVRTEDITVVIS